MSAANRTDRVLPGSSPTRYSALTATVLFAAPSPQGPRQRLGQLIRVVEDDHGLKDGHFSLKVRQI